MGTPLGQLSSAAPIPGNGLQDEMFVRRRLLAGGNVYASTFNSPLIAADGSQPAQALHYYDPADFAIAGKTPKMRVEMLLFTNAVVPGVTFEVGYYPLSGLSGSGPTFTLGAAFITAGFSGPSANTVNFTSSPEFDPPGSAGYYALATVHGGSLAANACVRMACQLWLRYV
jgi:hypothetical protein